MRFLRWSDARLRSAIVSFHGIPLRVDIYSRTLLRHSSTPVTQQQLQQCRVGAGGRFRARISILSCAANACFGPDWAGPGWTGLAGFVFGGRKETRKAAYGDMGRETRNAAHGDEGRRLGRHADAGGKRQVDVVGGEHVDVVGFMLTSPDHIFVQVCAKKRITSIGQTVLEMKRLNMCTQTMTPVCWDPRYAGFSPWLSPVDSSFLLLHPRTHPLISK